MALVHAAPGEKVHLPSLASMSEDAMTSALVKTDSFEAVHLILRSGTVISPHAVAGYMTLLCLEGAVTLKNSCSIELHSGDWVYLDRGEQHGLTAIKDSSLVLTILFDRRGDK